LRTDSPQDSVEEREADLLRLLSKRSLCLACSIVAPPFGGQRGDVASRLPVQRVEVERLGIPIGDADMRIAAIAPSRGLRVVTGNERHFGRIPGLETENWLHE
jgi:hypothetical protein